jgi:chitinase
VNRSIRTTICALLFLAATALWGAGAAAGSPSGNMRGAFFANWDRYARGYFVNQIPARQLDVIDYAFAGPTASGTCALSDPWSDYQAPTWTGDTSVDGVADDPNNPDQHLFGNFNQFRKLKAAHPNLKVVMSLGGWTLSTYFSDVAATPASREAFVRSCIDLIVKGNLPTGGWPTQAGGDGTGAGVFDGIDVDWEYPGIDPGNGAHHSPADKHNATLLLQEFRRQLDAYGATTGKHYLLTADLPAGNVNSTGSWELAAVARTTDWINVMTFDFHGSWDPWTDFNSPFALDPKEPPVGGAVIQSTWSTKGTVDYYLANGVPADKILLAIPFYGKRYVGVPGTNNGLYQPFVPQAWPFNDSPTFHELVDTGLTDGNLTVIGPTAVAAPKNLGNDGQGINGFTRYWKGAAGAPWLYNPILDGGTFISYMDPHSVVERVQLAQSKHLLGVWAWEISQDDNANDLVEAMASGAG